MTRRPAQVVPSLAPAESEQHGPVDDDLDLLLAWSEDPTALRHDPDLLVWALTAPCDEASRSIHRSFGVCTTCRPTVAPGHPLGQASVSGASSHA